VAAIHVEAVIATGISHAHNRSTNWLITYVFQLHACPVKNTLRHDLRILRVVIWSIYDCNIKKITELVLYSILHCTYIDPLTQEQIRLFHNSPQWQWLCGSKWISRCQCIRTRRSSIEIDCLTCFGFTKTLYVLSQCIQIRFRFGYS